MPRKKKAALVKAATRAALGGKPGKPRKAAKAVRVGGKKEERRLAKLEQRRRDKAKITPGQWAEPAPAHLVGTLNVPRAKSKYQSYFEFAENTEKKKKLEFQASTSTLRVFLQTDTCRRIPTIPIRHPALHLFQLAIPT